MSPSTGFPELLTSWLGAQRWFAGKGRAPQLRRIGGWELPATGVRITTHLIMDDSGSSPTLYQVPVTERSQPLEGAEHALIAAIEVEGEAARYLYDGAYDPEYREALLRMTLEGSTAIPDGAEATGLPFDPLPEDISIIESRVLSGEQSNTSMIYEISRSDRVESVICKMFRALHHGDNPDVVLQAALASAGSPHVPRPVGAVVGEWVDVGRPDGRARGHLACAQEFLPGSEDGWRLALREASADHDFTDRAYDLGVVTAEIHLTLAQVEPTAAVTDDDITRTLASFQRRLDLAIDEVPAVAEFREPIERLYRSAREAVWPPIQRIHGDYHLGQVLATPDGRWVVLDFEGEPLRPMVERSRPDCAMRDVAGMLRSFDYVAGSLRSTDTAEEWARSCRRAFLDGYIDRSGRDLRGDHTLLDVFEVDKAIYEAVYEARNRPDWVAIPMAALQRLTERTSTLG